MAMSRYEFLARAHEILKPKIYLEIGVQYGGSLALAEAAEQAIGVDPAPMVSAEHQRPNQVIDDRTADEHFAPVPVGISFIPHPEVDFAFIDGSHLFEDALQDFINVEQVMADGGVMFFDDVLPYNEAIAERIQPAGDWTGDVWKIVEVLRLYRFDLELTLIDVEPTGLMMLRPADDWIRSEEWNREPEFLSYVAAKINETGVPDHILKRAHAVSGEAALGLLRKGLQ